MNKLLLLAAALLLSVSCVDRDFDLSDIDTGDIGIGGAESEFRLPLARIRVLGSAVEGTYDSLENIFGEADLWLPTSCTSLDLARLSEDAYVDALTDELLGELHTNPAKLDDVAAMLERTPSYREAIAGTIPGELRGISVYEYVTEHLNMVGQYSRGKLREIIFNHLDSMNSCIDSVEERIEGFGIDEGVINALAGEGSFTAVYGSAVNRLPVDCTGTFELVAAYDDPDYYDDYYGDGDAEEVVCLRIDGIRLLCGSESEIARTTVTADDLRRMCGAMKMRVALAATTYYPRHGVPAGADDAMELTLKLYKKGGLNLSDL